MKLYNIAFQQTSLYPKLGAIIAESGYLTIHLINRNPDKNQCKSYLITNHNNYIIDIIEFTVSLFPSGGVREGGGLL